MTSSTKTRLIGVGMMIPLPVYAIYLLTSGKLFTIVVPLLILGVLAHFGLKLAKGKSASDVTQDALDRASKIDSDASMVGGNK